MIPLQSFDLVNVTEGEAVLIVGVMAMLLLASIQLRNPAGLVAWGVTLVLLALTVTLDLGSEWMWVGVVITSLLVLVGAVVRWMR